jgi:sodium/proline symporter
MLAIISAAAWGLGYFGQPHILARFMSAKSLVKIKESMTIAIVWVFVSLCGAVVVGLVAIGMFDGLADGQEDKVFIYMIGDLFDPWTGGILLAAILSAIMSTIDSQLLVSSSALTEDFYQKIIRPNASQKEIVLIGRLCVIVMSIIAAFLALTWEKSIMTIVKYAWAGFGAAFGPVVLFALFSRRTGWLAALAGMTVGAVVVVVWRLTGMSQHMYEIVPGFIANCATIVVVNSFAGQKDTGVFEEFRQVKTIVRGGKS